MRLVTVAPLPGESVLEILGVEWFREWWEAHRPGWVDPSWWSMPLREEVAAVLRLPSGPGLLAAIQALDSGTCAAQHGDEGMPGDPAPGSAPGFPCGCQLVLVAAWRAVSDWTAVRSAEVLTDAVAAEPVVIPRDGDRRPGITDPAREEVAVAIRLVPGSTAAQMRKARALVGVPAVARLGLGGAAVPGLGRAVARVPGPRPRCAVGSPVRRSLVRAEHVAGAGVRVDPRP